MSELKLLCVNCKWHSRPVESMAHLCNKTLNISLVDGRLIQTNCEKERSGMALEMFCGFYGRHWEPK